MFGVLAAGNWDLGLKIIYLLLTFQLSYILDRMNRKATVPKRPTKYQTRSIQNWCRLAIGRDSDSGSVASAWAQGFNPCLGLGFRFRV